MRRPLVLETEFVGAIPEKLRDRTLYVSLDYGTVAHKCCCGCGREVVTPLSPTDWRLAYDGLSVSLYPSIGNWNFPCQSHYWIEKSKVRWADRWTQDQIDAGRAKDRLAKERHVDGTHAPLLPEVHGPADGLRQIGLWDRILKWLSGR